MLEDPIGTVVSVMRCSIVACAIALSPFLSSTPAFAQAATREATAAGKPRLAIQKIDVTSAVRQDVAKDAAANNGLEQIVQATENQILNAIEQTRKFEVVARQDLKEILEEQDLQDSGLVRDDAQRAKKFELAGAAFTLALTIDNYQDVVTRAQFEGQLGSEMLEKRRIQLQATCKIYNTTTGTLLRSMSRSFEFGNEPGQEGTIAGQSREGRASNWVLGAAARDLARFAANDITDFVFPAKIIAFTNGVLTFNRTKESGVEPGAWYEVFAPGEEMFDPDTGESLGSEEVHIGWAKVTSALDRFSKAQAYDDMGIDCESILRVYQGEPEGASALQVSRGSCQPTPRSSASPAGRSQPAAERTVDRGDQSSLPSPEAPPAAERQEEESKAIASAEKPLRAAIFVKNRASEVPDEMVMVLEDAIIGFATDRDLEIIPREDVVNAVSAFADAGSNSGSGDPDSRSVDRALSDQTSAASLAGNLGADAVLVSSITSLTKATSRVNRPDLGIDRTIHEWKLTVGYRVLDGATGGSLAAGDAVIERKFDSGGASSRSDPEVEDLLREAGKDLAIKLQWMIRTGKMRAQTEAAAETLVQVMPSIVDLSIPEITMVDGKPTISSGRYKLEPTAVNVYIDGLLVGTAPGAFPVKPGLRRIRCERPMFQPYEGMMKVREGMILTIPMKLTDEGLARWKENAQFFESLKERAKLTDAQVEVAKGMAEFLRESRINIDTSQLQSIEVNNNFWGGVLR